METVRVGIIGTGGVSGNHIRALEGIYQAEIAVLYDANLEAAAVAAKRSGALHAKSVEEVVEKTDAILVLTPPHTHRSIATAALRAGNHVLCEKPLAVSLDDGRAIAAEAEASRAIFMTAFSQRFRPSLIRMREVARSGQLGRPITMYCQRMFNGGGHNPDNWRYREESRCGMTIESVSHQIDMIRWILDTEVASVYSQSVSSMEELPDVDDNIHAVLTLENGCRATVHVSWSSWVQTNATGINCTAGTIRINGSGSMDHDEMLFATASAELERTPLAEPYDASIFAAEDRHFIDCILAGRSPGPTHMDGLRALEVSHAMIESSERGEVVAVQTIGEVR